MRIAIVVCLSLLWCSSLLAQQHHVPLYVTGGIDTANVEIAQVVKLWRDYLSSNPDSTYDNPYWLASASGNLLPS